MAWQQDEETDAAIQEELTQLQTLSSPTLRIQRCCQLVVTFAEELKGGASPAVQLHVQHVLCSLLSDAFQAPQALDALKPAPLAALPRAKAPQLKKRRTEARPAGQQPQPDAHGCSTAEAWAGASEALQVLCSLQHEGVVRGILLFWQQTAETLSGSWLCPKPNSAAEQQEQVAEHMGRWVLWLCEQGPPLLAAVVEQMYSFYQLTGITIMKACAYSPFFRTLLLLLQLSAMSDYPQQQLQQQQHQADDMTTDAPTKQEAAVHRMLQLTDLDDMQPSAAATWQQHQHMLQQHLRLASVLNCREAFTLVSGLVQHIAQHEQATRASHAASMSSLAASAVQFINEGYQPRRQQYGCASSRFTAAAGESQEYDACMLMLLDSLVWGPPGSPAGQSPNAAAALAGAADPARPSAAAVDADANGGSDCAKARIAACWAAQHDWHGSTSFTALSAIVATHGNPSKLFRGLVATYYDTLKTKQDVRRFFEALDAVYTCGGTVALVPSLDTEAAAAGGAADWAENGSGAVAARAAVHSVVAVLEGCGALLLPDANAAAEWRAEAVEQMYRSMQEYLNQHADDDELHASAWASASAALDALFFSLRHDPSIRVRRAAMKLLTLVALPADAPAAATMLEVLALKAADKDAAVSAAAQELLLQLPWEMVCGAVSEAKWVGMVGALVEMLACQQQQQQQQQQGEEKEEEEEGAGNADPAGGRHGTQGPASKAADARKPRRTTARSAKALSAAAQAAAWDMLRGVLLAPLPAVTSATQAAAMPVRASGQAAAVARCQRALQLLLVDAGWASQVLALAEVLEVQAEADDHEASDGGQGGGCDVRNGGSDGGAGGSGSEAGDEQATDGRAADGEERRGRIGLAALELMSEREEDEALPVGGPQGHDARKQQAVAPVPRAAVGRSLAVHEVLSPADLVAGGDMDGGLTFVIEESGDEGDGAP